MKWIIIILGMLVLPVALLSACGNKSATDIGATEVEVDGGYYRDITAEQFKSMLENKDFLLVNVHIPYEGEIPDTDLFVPYNEIEQNLSQFPEDRGVKIVLYCRSGSMSAIAARKLVGLGFTDIWNLDGGMVEWERKGNEIIRK